MRKLTVLELLLCMNVYNTEFISLKKWVSIKYYKVVFYTKKGEGTQEYFLILTLPPTHLSPSACMPSK